MSQWSKNGCDSTIILRIISKNQNMIANDKRKSLMRQVQDTGKSHRTTS